MKLELGKIQINDVKFGSTTEVNSGLLTVNKDKLVEEIIDDNQIKSLDVELAKPGDSIRIIPVKDVVEPRVKVEGAGGIFPGIIAEEDMVGSGRTHALKGVGVVTTGKIVGFQEGIIDMSGPGAEYTPFSKLNNIVITCEVASDIEQHEHEEIVRMTGLKAANYIGKVAQDLEPDEIEEFESKPIPEAVAEYPDLPKVGYIYMLQTQGLLHDTYVYGVDAKEILPTLVSPTEVMDGAIISGNCVSACDKNVTYVHQNNPIIEDLYKHHGTEYNFLGAIITNENVTLSDKKRSSNYTAKLAEQLGLDAAIISQEGFGNPDADLIMNCVKLEEKGIKTVLTTDEYAGRDGASQSLADADPKADAVVTAGNANETVTLPAMERIIGHQKVADVIAGGFDGSLHQDGSITVELQAITGATNELGFGNLTAREY
ncbi:glycine/sarcosine/betaine reductase component B subunit [Acetohalobium arabaticum]|uniref:Glycine/sarcosine/betaine reductase complex protein B alpha and beta subunits n=1 Tax=Acetohalobium arabaticum (strain ATCC 49924 / DSM 5501 / Z-7288) TaxID=574087 RepID=D9QPS6_ACEAZ|nr:glycine/sarcosine/betaine reductase component B subunit [Acetohalobium arabaticum]ADL12517.1 Glycine/sarcosine/betaine reductase complex protein B alpha and beta subunits [Acetohalobium arabaticum DSM 5501]